MHLPTAAAEADRGVVHVNDRRIGCQTCGVVIHAPFAIAVGVASVDAGHIQDFNPILPKSDVPIIGRRSFVARFDAKPLSFGNVLDGLAMGVVSVLIIQVEVHGSVGAIPHVQSHKGIVGAGALGFPLENVPPGGMSVRNIMLREVKPNAVIKFRVLFRLAPAEQSRAARREVPGIQSIDKERRGMKAAVSEANRVHSGGGKAAVEHSSAGVWTACDIGNTPLRKIASFHVSRPEDRAEMGGNPGRGGL